jgi:hypothetical protein
VPTGKPQNRFERVEKSIEAIKLIGRLALAGETAPAIAIEMMARSIDAPLGGKQWNPASVRMILANPIYSSAEWVFGKRTYRTIEESERKRKRRNPDPDHMTRRVILRPRSEWLALPLPGGAIWSPEEQAAIIEALKRNGRQRRASPSRSTDVKQC